jgi:hypothetical protein
MKTGGQTQDITAAKMKRAAIVVPTLGINKDHERTRDHIEGTPVDVNTGVLHRTHTMLRR